MDFGDAPVVATEKSDEIARQVSFVGLGQRTHDAEIERDILTVAGDENIAGVHIGMEKAVAEHLGEKDFNAGTRKLRNVDALCAHVGNRGDRNAVHALHDHDFGGTVLPVDFRHGQQR